MLRPTALIYSSHNRGDYLHRNFIVERALEHPENKTIFFLPMSMSERHQQEYSYGTFSWYFRRFEQQGLRHWPFFYHGHLRQEDVEKLFHSLRYSQVVILGGGNSELGMERYRELGQRHFGDRHLFRHVLHERQREGLLTVGFSAGADQLAHHLTAAIDEQPHEDLLGFSLVRNVLVTLHHERGREWDLQVGARQFPHSMVFGLPNDSGLLVSQTKLPSGNTLQLIEFILDTSWDDPKDGWHIKTRHGMKIEHYYADGRHWSFNNGDRMIRVISPDGLWTNAWIARPNQPLLHHDTQNPSYFKSLEDIARAH